jgi:hypothetical protein
MPPNYLVLPYDSRSHYCPNLLLLKMHADVVVKDVVEGVLAEVGVNLPRRSLPQKAPALQTALLNWRRRSIPDNSLPIVKGLFVGAYLCFKISWPR